MHHNQIPGQGKQGIDRSKNTFLSENKNKSVENWNFFNINA